MKVKICGLTREEDVILVNKLGADYTGFIFYDKSPRRADPEEIGRILRLHKLKAVPVGVFVDEKIENILYVNKLTGISVFQLHGDEDQNMVDCLKEKGFMVIKTLSIRDRKSFSDMKKYKVDHFLLDTWHDVLKGGTGQSFDWNLLAGQEEKLVNSFISGGINPLNLKELLKKFSPWGIDLNSGVESQKGRKDPKKLEEVFNLIKK